jgi:hypothetical protein
VADLSAWQREVLRAFFARERGFFLTGGAALAGFCSELGTTGVSELNRKNGRTEETGENFRSSALLVNSPRGQLSFIRSLLRVERIARYAALTEQSIARTARLFRAARASR